MNEVCREYVRQVEASMACSRRNRGKLLSGFERELEEAFPDDAAPAVAELTARFGTPEALAAELMAALPEGAAAVAACVAVIALLIGYLAWLGSIDVDVSKTETKITYGPVCVVEE